MPRQSRGGSGRIQVRPGVPDAQLCSFPYVPAGLVPLTAPYFRSAISSGFISCTGQCLTPWQVPGLGASAAGTTGMFSRLVQHRLGPKSPRGEGRGVSTATGEVPELCVHTGRRDIRRGN